MTTDLLKSHPIEQLGVYLENNKILAPLATRIFSVLTLFAKKRVCFDEYDKGLDANKNSFITNLQLVMGLRYSRHSTS